MRLLEATPDSSAIRRSIVVVRSFSATGSRSRVIDLANRARAIAERWQGTESAATLAAIDNLADCLRIAGAYSMERAYLEHELAARQRALPSNGVACAKTASRLGFACYRLDDHAAAAAAWRTSLALWNAQPVVDAAAVVRTLKFLSEAERLLGRAPAAESLLVDAVVRSKSARLPRDATYASLISNLGGLYWDEGRFDEAESLFREALQVSEADAKAPASRLATAHLNLGVLLRDQNRDEEAVPHLEEALRRARAGMQADDPRMVLFLSESARLHFMMREPKQASALWEEALQLVVRLPVPQPIYRAEILYDLGRAELQAGRVSRAEARLNEARLLQEKVFGPAHPELAMTLTALAQARVARYGAGDRTAHTLVTQALPVLERSPVAPDVEADAYAAQARFLRARGQSSAARHSLERALEIVEEIRPRRGPLDASRAALMSVYADLYDDLIAWHHESGANEAALRWAERRRARILRDYLAAARVDPRQDVPPEVLRPLAKREREARARLQRAQSELDDLRKAWTASEPGGITAIRDKETELATALREQQALEAEIRLHSPSWLRALRAPAAELTTRHVQDALVPTGAVLLEYAIGKHRSFVFVVPTAPGAVICHELRIPAEVARGLGVAPGPLSDSLLATLVGRGFDAPETSATLAERRITGVASVSTTDKSSKPVTSLPRSSPLSRSHMLWRLLFPPEIQACLHGMQEAIVVPDGPLHRLAFEALVVREGKSDAERRFWLDEGPSVRYAQSITTLLEIASRKISASGARRPLLTVSDPAFEPGQAEATPDHDDVSMASPPISRGVPTRWKIPRLPATARESAALRAAFQNDSIVCLQGRDATESKVKRALPGARIVHLATHGVVEEGGDPRLAGLLFAPEKTEDGWLHLFEIQSLTLDCDLAVLSTCDSQAGEPVRGEGTFALSRGFLAAGARRTVASLWPAADEATAELMSVFFRGIAAAEAHGAQLPPYATLLRQAKLQLRQDPRWSAPYYWAPFVLVGVR